MDKRKFERCIDVIYHDASFLPFWHEFHVARATAAASCFGNSPCQARGLWYGPQWAGSGKLAWPFRPLISNLASNMINLNQFDIFGILNSNTTLSGNLVLCRPLDSSLDSVQHPMDLLMLEMGANINIINSASINSLG
jgi:hypothetical protein